MSRARGWLALGLLACTGAVAACAGSSTSALRGCGFPPPVPIPQLWLVYPAPSAGSVPDAIGILVFAGITGSGLGIESVSMQSAGGATVPIGPFAAAPSPLPSPYATPLGSGSGVPLAAAPIPALSPSTTYVVSYAYSEWNDVPPACSMQVTRQLGTFTTR